jgi:hypothetical protein
MSDTFEHTVSTLLKGAVPSHTDGVQVASVLRKAESIQHRQATIKKYLPPAVAAGVFAISAIVVAIVVGTASHSNNGAAASAVPREFRHACGHPGSHVIVKHVPVTVSHAACDLTGVDISYPGHGAAYVPAPGATVSNGLGIDIRVDADTQDVTINAVGPSAIM